MLGKRSLVAAALSVVLVVGLWPGAAMADLHASSSEATSVASVGTQAATRTVNGVTLEQESGVWTVTGYSGSATSLNLNSLGVGVITRIGDSAFEGCTRLKSVTLPSTLQEIGSYAFQGCTGLRSLVLPESLSYVDWCAFKNCTGLTSVKVRSRSLGVDYSAFANAGTGASGITATFASTCGAVPGSMFYASDEGAPKVKKVVVASGVKGVGDSAFYDCSYLSSVSLGSGITKIRDRAFCGCSSLKSVTLPSTLQEIGSYAFQGCTGLRSLVLPESLSYVDWRAFKNCTGLTSVKVRSRSLGVDYSAFANAGTGASGITATFASTCGAVPGSMFYASDEGAPKVKKVVVASGVKGVGDSAFYGCSYLTSVSLPASITSIGSHAFQDCSSLKSLRIPQNVSADNLGWNAYVNLGLNSKLTVTTGAQYKKLRRNSDYITTTRTTVVLASNSLYRAKVSSISKKAYTGKRIKPSPVVKLGGKKLKKGTDYTLSYKANKALGVATVTVKGKGRYVGTKSVTFKIVPAKVKGVKVRSTYSGTATVSWSKKSRKLAVKAGASGYRIYYKVAGKRARYEDVWSSESSNQTLYGLTPRKKVKVKVQAYGYINGNKVYGAWSAAKTVKVRR